MKESRPADTTYALTIHQLGSGPPFTSIGSSLSELVRLVRDFVPVMDDFSKVYRKMRNNVGVYVELFVLPAEKQKVRHVVVTINPDTIFEADLQRFYAKLAKAPVPPDGTEREAASEQTASGKKALSKRRK